MSKSHWLILILCSILFSSNISAQWTTIGSYVGGGSNKVEIDYDEISDRLLVASFDAGAINLKSYNSGVWTTHASLPAQFDNFMLKADPLTGEPWVAVNQNDTLNAYKYDGAIWIKQGPSVVNARALGEVDLEFNPATNHPNICAEIPETTTGQYNIIKLYDFDGSSWSSIGVLISTTNTGSYLDLEFDPSNNEPVVVYNYATSVGNRTVEVRKYTNSAWTLLGTPDIGNNPTFNEISFDFQNNLILNFRNSTILKWNGSSWVQGSNATTTFNDVSIELDPIYDNLWFVPVNDWARELNGVVLNYVGNTMPLIPASYPRLTFNEINGKCYVACRDNNNDILVKEFIRSFVGVAHPSKTTLTIFPNPSQDFITISEAYSNLKIYSLDGRLVLTSQNSKIIDISKLDNSAYLVKVVGIDNNETLLKFVKQ